MLDEVHESEYLTAVSAARFLNYGTRSLHKWRKQGLECVKIGNFVRYPKSGLLEFMQRHRQNGKPQEVAEQKQDISEQKGGVE